MRKSNHITLSHVFKNYLIKNKDEFSNGNLKKLNKVNRADTRSGNLDIEIVLS